MMVYLCLLFVSLANAFDIKSALSMIDTNGSLSKSFNFIKSHNVNVSSSSLINSINALGGGGGIDDLNDKTNSLLLNLNNDDEAHKSMLANAILKNISKLNDANKTGSNRLVEKAASSSSGSSGNSVYDAASYEMLKSFSSISNPYLALTNVSDSCSQYLAIFTNELVLNHKNWTFYVLDALGKMGAGVLYGNSFYIGDFYECIQASNGIDWQGKYCFIHSSNDVPTIGKLPSSNLKFGICVPSMCSDQDVASLINFMISLVPTWFVNLNPYRLDQSKITCQNSSDSEVFDAASIVAITILAFFGLLILSGTSYDFYKRYFRKSNHSKEKQQLKFNSSSITNIEDEEEDDDYAEIATNLSDFRMDNEQEQQNATPAIATPATNLSIQVINTKVVQLLPTVESSVANNHLEIKKIPKRSIKEIGLQILLAFSVVKNAEQIFNLRKSSSQIDCLDSIRFISMAWVILGHTYLIPLGFFDNTFLLTEYMQRFFSLIVTNAYFSVDSFFVLSGMLTSYSFVRDLNQPNGGHRLSIFFMLKYYVHRLIRLTPPYMIVLMINATLTRYFGQGPFYPKDGYESNMCRDTWWQNLLYINNFFYGNEQKPCFGVTWYLATDMQFYWIAPIFLIPLALKKHAIGLTVCFLFIVANILSTALILNANPGSEEGILGSEFYSVYFALIYVKPWGRIAPYVCGTILGHSFYFCRKATTFKFNKILNAALWILAISGLAAMVFILYPDFNGTPLSRVGHIFYWSFCRLVWGICLAYIIFACATSNGGFVNLILSWPIWKPLSRLTYAAYLTHSTVITFYIYNNDRPMHLLDIIMAWNFVSYVAFSYATALVVSLCFEIPFRNIDRIIFPRSSY